jgi:hypothetical protein
LKRQYGLEFEDETISHEDGNGNIPEYKPQERKDITPNQDVIDVPPTQPKQQQDSETDKINQLVAEINKKFKKLGITTKDAKNEYTMKHVPDFKANIAGYTGLSKLLDMHIDLQESQDELPLDDDQLV